MRLDLALGVVFGLLLILLTPGLAIAGLYALLAIVLCVASVAAGWFVRRRRGRLVRRPSRTAGGDGDRSLGVGHRAGAPQDDQPGRW
jgi:membrane protein implicated in regulation of membrane protease activity